VFAFSAILVLIVVKKSASSPIASASSLSVSSTAGASPTRFDTAVDTALSVSVLVYTSVIPYPATVVGVVVRSAN